MLRIKYLNPPCIIVHVFDLISSSHGAYHVHIRVIRPLIRPMSDLAVVVQLLLRTVARGATKLNKNRSFHMSFHYNLWFSHGFSFDEIWNYNLRSAHLRRIIGINELPRHADGSSKTLSLNFTFLLLLYHKATIYL